MKIKFGLLSLLLCSYFLAIVLATFSSDYVFYIVIVSAVSIWLARPGLRRYVIVVLSVAFIAHSIFFCDALFEGPLTRRYNDRMQALFLSADLTGASLEDTKKVLGEPSYCRMEDGNVRVLGYKKFNRFNFGVFKVFFTNNRVSSFKMLDY